MTLKRITSREELLEYVVSLYARYNKDFKTEQSDFISRYYLQDFLKHLLLIQRYASDDGGKERTEGSTDLS